MTSTLPSYGWIIIIILVYAIGLFLILAAIGNIIFYRKKIKKFFKEMKEDFVFMLTFPTEKVNI